MVNLSNFPFSPLVYKPVGTSWNGLDIYRLTKPLTYMVDVDNPNSWITVPEGFITDFASIPKGFRDKLPAYREYAPAAVIHDYLYSSHDENDSRFEADWTFLKAMKDCGTPLKGRWAMFLAVRLYGKLAWDMHLGWDPLLR